MKPDSIVDFISAREYLKQFVPLTPGAYKLDRMVKLMDFLGDPQNKLKIIHVAGTSGKTSTCYYIAALLKESGHSVGHTVSPHVEEVNERAQIDLAPLPKSEYCTELKQFAMLVEESGTEPTYFELLVAFAYWVFEKRGLDYAVVEVGLGGLHDGTNVVENENKVCVITDIGFDHTDILGNTLAEIAFQKAGIIKHGNKVFMHDQVAEVNNIIQSVTSENDGELVRIPKHSHQESGLPPFQRRNFALAEKVAVHVLNRDGYKPLSEAQITGSAAIHIPARMEVVEFDGKTVIVDGSHNEQKIAALVEGVNDKYAGRDIDLLVSFGENKASIALSNLELLRQLADKITLTSFSSVQDGVRKAIDPEELSTMSRLAGFEDIQVVHEPEAALEKALEKSSGILLITGSYFLLNHLRPKLVRTR